MEKDRIFWTWLRNVNKQYKYGERVSNAKMACAYHDLCKREREDYEARVLDKETT